MTTVEERLATVEAEVAQLKEQIRSLNGISSAIGALPGIGKIGCLEKFPDPEGLAEAMKQARDELNRAEDDDPSEA